jgi:cytidyltransferase-like protein
MIVGCINGRFQPFHNGHFEYLLAAAQRCDRIIIGITQYDPDTQDDESPKHRMDEGENPFTYWERYCIINAAIAKSELATRSVDIVPFPIHAPSMIKNFVDPRSIMFTTIYDAWNIRKIRRLKEIGFQVSVLWRRKVKEIEGKRVRAAMRQDFALFETLVPDGVASTIKSLMRKEQGHALEG